MSLERRLDKIEEQLNMVLRKLKLIEDLLALEPQSREEILILLSLAVGSVSFEGNVINLIRDIVRVERILRQKGFADDLSRWLLRLLALYGPMNISQLARILRQWRGRASRRTISKKLVKLEELGLVRRSKRGKGKVYTVSRS